MSAVSFLLHIIKRLKHLSRIYAAFSTNLAGFWTGFHHFLPGHLEDMNIQLVNAKTCKDTGLIIADVLCDQHLESGKTFFPSSWSRIEVLKKLGEAANNPIDIPIVSGARMSFFGQTSEKIIVKIVVDIKSGDYVTAYPDAIKNGLL